ncbi:MAG TPA: tRNA (adenosine(37)-N6)-threonylcarbamoyltransferase complex transferase subunit TsaD [Elusimicrobiales bacterium]|nr:tRNA (adenosine(37)-N6)-threonylcarbamoyltransferase complex transferase subunit TsaD [Elusimicrobiales bacterium]
MRILGIETTCDETAAAVLDGRGRVLSNVVYSQIPLHKKYRGVVPELASRAHCAKIADVVESALEQAGLLKAARPFDAVAYASGPGLPGALLVGRTAAGIISRLYGVREVPVNHLEGHLLSCELHDGKPRALEFPLIALIASGGHTELWLVKGYGRYKALGRTRDDAAGEAFDKVAKLLGLDYPGGPAVEKCAQKGSASAVQFPRPFLPGTDEFSFSGLKTAVSYRLQGSKGLDKADVCAAFQAAVVETLVAKTLAAARRNKVRLIAVGGGVAANSALREQLAEEAGRSGIKVRFVERKYCTDNGAMLALAALKKLKASGCKTAAARINPELKIKSWAETA